jgi:exonuclease III
MRIVTWNCQMGLDKKLEALASLRADVAVVPECSKKSAVALREHGYKTLWFGKNPHKGLGVMCRDDWAMRALAQPEQMWIAPVEVDAPVPFVLMAVWACAAGVTRAEHYIGQVYRAMMAHPEWFGARPTVVAGDLNSNKIWDKNRVMGNHSDVVRMLREHGVVSAYHEYFGEEQGEESRSTTYLYRHEDRPFHLDYVFIPGEWARQMKTVEVGGYKQWAKLSDHCPVMVEVEL